LFERFDAGSMGNEAAEDLHALDRPPGITLNAMADKLTTTPLTSDSPFPP
jgi:hypothetical protein